VTPRFQPSADTCPSEHTGQYGKDLKPFISINQIAPGFEFKTEFSSGMQAFRDMDLNAASRSLTKQINLSLYAQCNLPSARFIMSRKL
jgi:hypothetical protein